MLVLMVCTLSRLLSSGLLRSECQEGTMKLHVDSEADALLSGRFRHRDSEEVQPGVVLDSTREVVGVEMLRLSI